MLGEGVRFELATKIIQEGFIIARQKLKIK